MLVYSGRWAVEATIYSQDIVRKEAAYYADVEQA
jgi:hypothetical protein